MNDIELRFASEDDAEKLLAIYAPYVQDTAVTFEWEVPTLEDFRNRIKDKIGVFPYIVAERDGEIIGYAYASKYRTRYAYSWTVESSIYLRMDCRGAGAGRILLEKLEELLTKQNILNIYACIAYNKEEDEYWTRESIAFHEKMGYKKVAEQLDCGYKFGRWYGLATLEKMLGTHTENPAPVLPCDYSIPL